MIILSKTLLSPLLHTYKVLVLVLVAFTDTDGYLRCHLQPLPAIYIYPSNVNVEWGDHSRSISFVISCNQWPAGPWIQWCEIWWFNLLVHMGRAQLLQHGGARLLQFGLHGRRTLFRDHLQKTTFNWWSKYFKLLVWGEKMDLKLKSGWEFIIQDNELTAARPLSRKLISTFEVWINSTYEVLNSKNLFSSR